MLAIPRQRIRVIKSRIVEFPLRKNLEARRSLRDTWIDLLLSIEEIKPSLHAVMEQGRLIDGPENELKIAFEREALKEVVDGNLGLIKMCLKEQKSRVTMISFAVMRKEGQV